MSATDGGPAFPVPGLQDDEDFNGMSLRNYFAAKAMQGLLANASLVLNIDAVIKDAFVVADAMLAAGNQTEKK